MPLQGTTLTFFRGGSVYWQTTFYDIFNNVAQPQAAFLNVDFPNPDGSRGTELITMTPPATGFVYWTAFLDTRNMGVGPLNWSIHTGGAVPVSVEDGTFQLKANPANLVNF